MQNSSGGQRDERIATWCTAVCTAQLTGICTLVPSHQCSALQLSAGLVQLPIEQPAKLRHQDPNVKDQSSLNRLSCLCDGSWRTLSLLLLLTISEHVSTYCYSEDCAHLLFILDISFIYLRTSEPLWPVAKFWQRVSLTFSFGGGSRTLETSAPAALARYSITGVLNAKP